MSNGDNEKKRTEQEIYWGEPAVYANWFFANVNSDLTRIVFCDRAGEQISSRTAVVTETKNIKMLIGLLNRLIAENETTAGTIIQEPKKDSAGGGSEDG